MLNERPYKDIAFVIFNFKNFQMFLYQFSIHVGPILGVFPACVSVIDGLILLSLSSEVVFCKEKQRWSSVWKLQTFMGTTRIQQLYFCHNFDFRCPLKLGSIPFSSVAFCTYWAFLDPNEGNLTCQRVKIEIFLPFHFEISLIQ